MQPPDPAEVRSQLERVLSAGPLANAGRLSRFLRYIVERTLAGEGEQLKEYVLGTEVFDRPVDYDPRLDSIVRVEARRLRAKLEEYYQGPGANDSIIITVPRGSYLPVFERRVAAPPVVAPPRVRSQARRLIVGLLGAAALIVVIIAGWPRTPGTPAAPQASSAYSIAVLPFQHFSTDAEVALLAARLTDGVTSNLAREGKLSVVSHTSAAQYTGEMRPVREIGKALGADLVMEGSLVVEQGRVKVTARLVNAHLDRKVWVGEYDVRADEISDLQRKLASEAGTAALNFTRW